MAKANRTHLLEERPIIVYPTLAQAIGVNAAILFQQLHFLLEGAQDSKSEFNFVDGRFWVYNTYKQWRSDHFPWMSESTIKAIFLYLENCGIVLSMQSVKHSSDRTKWYSVDYDRWSECSSTIGQKLSDGWDKNCLIITGQKLSDPSDENYPMINGQKPSDVYTESTPETTTKSTILAGASPAPMFLRNELPILPANADWLYMQSRRIPTEWHIASDSTSLCGLNRGVLSQAFKLDSSAPLCPTCVKNALQGPPTHHEPDLSAVEGKRAKRGAKGGQKRAKEPQPQSVLTKAMFEAIPESIRPVTCHYGKNDTPAKALLAAGFTATQITDYVSYAYECDPWIRTGDNGSPIILSMSMVAGRIKAAQDKVTIWKGTRTNGNSTQQTQPGQGNNAGTDPTSEERERRAIIRAFGYDPEELP